MPKRPAFFNKNITPSCSYCKYGVKAREANMILCEKCGVTSPNYSCKRFAYEPLRRIPNLQNSFPTFLENI